MKYYEMSLKYAAISGDAIYILCDPIPYIIEIDICTKDIRKKIICPEKINPEGELFSGIYVENDKLALVPLCAKNLWIYDLKNDMWDKIDISKHVTTETKYKFYGGQMKSSTLYMYGYDYKGILSIDIETYEMYEILENGDKSGGFKGVSTVIKGNDLYIPRRDKNELIMIDINTRQYKLKNLNIRTHEDNDGIAYDGSSFFVLKNSGNVLYKFDEEFLNVEELYFDNFFDSIKNFFWGIECFDKKIFFYGPNRCGYIFDLENKKKSHIINDNIFYVKKLNNSSILLLKKGTIEIWDTKMQDTFKIQVKFYKEELQDCLKNINVVGRVCLENDIFGLEELIGLISNYS